MADEIRKLSETSTGWSKTISLQLKNIGDTISNIISSSSEFSRIFKFVSEEIIYTNDMVEKIKSIMYEFLRLSEYILESLKVMSNASVKVLDLFSNKTSEKNLINAQMKNLMNVMEIIKRSVDEIQIGANEINKTGVMFTEISTKVRQFIMDIGKEINEFKV